MAVSLSPGVCLREESKAAKRIYKGKAHASEKTKSPSCYLADKELRITKMSFTTGFAKLKKQSDLFKNP